MVMIETDTRFMLPLTRDYSIRKRAAGHLHHQASILNQIASVKLDDPSRSSRWSK